MVPNAWPVCALSVRGCCHRKHIKQVCIRKPALKILPQTLSNCRRRSKEPSWQERGWQQGPYQARLPRLHQQLQLMGQHSLPGPHCNRLLQSLLVSLRAVCVVRGHCVPLAAGSTIV